MMPSLPALAKHALAPLAGVLAIAALSACSTTSKPPLTTAQAAEAQRNEAQHLFDQAQSFTAGEQYDDAINLYKRAVSIDPKNMLAWYYLGVICNHQQRYAEAVEAWRVAADIAPMDPRPYFALGLQYQELGMYGDAAACYDRSLEAQSDYLPALKKSVEVDQLNDNYTDVTLKRINLALLRETDPKWVYFLRMTQLKTQERVSRAGGSTGH